jgi:hypothetical protein
MTVPSLSKVPVTMTGDCWLQKHMREACLQEDNALKISSPKDGHLADSKTYSTKIKTGNHQYQRKKRQNQYDVKVPFAKVIINITGTALGEEKLAVCL